MAEYTGGHINTYYVDGVNGNNSNNGTSPGTAWKTIQYGFDKLADSTIGDGDELRIMATKVYHIGAVLDMDWNGKEVVISGCTSANTALVDGTIVEINGNTAAMDGLTMMHGSVGTLDGTVFQNFYINAADNAGACLHQSVTNSHNVSWVNCRFSSAKSVGVQIDQSSYYNFINCRFDNNGDRGLEENGSNFNLHYKCLFDNNEGDGAYVQQFSRIVECIFTGNSGDGLEQNNLGNITANCIMHGNYDHGHKSQGSGQSIHIGNIYSNNGLDGSGSGTIVGSGCEARFINSVWYGNDDIWGYTSGSDHMAVYNSITAGTDPGFLSPAGPTFDFTPSHTFNGIGAGLPTPYSWFGKTADDVGVNKFKSSESISVF